LGQVVNLQKSKKNCSRNVAQAEHDNIANILGVKTVLRTEKYLGLPSAIKRNKKSMFTFIKDRIWRKIIPWRKKCLSKVGCDALIKSVLQDIPTYFMSLFTLPASLCDEIEKTMNVFWWVHSGVNDNGI
jgi:hypothetical protein